MPENNEKSSDALKLHDADINEFANDPKSFSISGHMIELFDQLNQSPDNNTMRMDFSVLAVCLYNTHPVLLYQTIRDHRTRMLQDLNIDLIVS